MKKKSRGQELWEFAAQEFDPNIKPWAEADSQLKKAYNKIAKRLYRSWTQKIHANYKKANEIVMNAILKVGREA